MTMTVRSVVTVWPVITMGSVTVILTGNTSAVLSSDYIILNHNSFDRSWFRSISFVKASIADFVSTVAN